MTPERAGSTSGSRDGNSIMHTNNIINSIMHSIIV